MALAGCAIKKRPKVWRNGGEEPIFAPPDGRLAERLGTGLQNLLQRFKSATDLKSESPVRCYEPGFSVFCGYCSESWGRGEQANSGTRLQ